MMILQTETGSINFISVPEGAAIYLNGIYQNTNTPCTVIDVPIGVYAYWLVLDGYIIAVDHVIVISNQISEIYVELIPITSSDSDFVGSVINMFKFVILVGGTIAGINLITDREHKTKNNIK